MSNPNAIPPNYPIKRKKWANPVKNDKAVMAKCPVCCRLYSVKIGSCGSCK